MLNKINYLETETERYPLVFTLNVMEAIQEKYGTIDAWSSLIQREGEPDIKALKFFMTEAINEGIEIENGSQRAAPGGRCRRADEQEKTQSIASGSGQDDNVFDREVRRKPVTSKEVGRILTEIGISGTANKIMATITDSVNDGKEKNSKRPQNA